MDGGMKIFIMAYLHKLPKPYKESMIQIESFGYTIDALYWYPEKWSGFAVSLHDNHSHMNNMLPMHECIS